MWYDIIGPLPALKRNLDKIKIHGLGFRAQHPRRNASLNEERDKCNLTDKGKGIMIARGG